MLSDIHRVRLRDQPADEVSDDVGVAHDDLVAVLLLLGVGAVDVAPEGCLDTSSIFVVLLEEGREVESCPCHMTGLMYDAAVHCGECTKSFVSK